MSGDVRGQTAAFLSGQIVPQWQNWFGAVGSGLNVTHKNSLSQAVAKLQSESAFSQYPVALWFSLQSIPGKLFISLPRPTWACPLIQRILDHLGALENCSNCSLSDIYITTLYCWQLKGSLILTYKETVFDPKCSSFVDNEGGRGLDFSLYPSSRQNQGVDTNWPNCSDMFLFFFDMCCLTSWLPVLTKLILLSVPRRLKRSLWNEWCKVFLQPL